MINGLKYDNAYLRNQLSTCRGEKEVQFEDEDFERVIEIVELKRNRKAT